MNVHQTHGRIVVGAGRASYMESPNVDMNETDPATDRVISALDERGLIVKPCSGYYMAQCPTHDDINASLSISEGHKGVVLRCHAGCTNEDIVAALGLTMRELFYDSAPGEQRAGAAGPAEYVYQRADGTEFAKVVRRRGKKFHQARRVGEHWESGGCPELNATLYRRPEVDAAVAARRTVLAVEGERDVETARELGVAATCNAGGAGKWTSAHAEHLHGADVVIVRDRDQAGREHAEKVHKSLQGVARSVRVVDPVPTQPGADFTDHIRAGYGVADLIEVETVATGRRSRITWATEIEPEPVVWAWTDDGEGRVPAGSQIIAAGREGTGKSSFGIWMGARITRGELPGAFHGTPRPVIFVTVEDSWKHTLVPRLIAAGADLSMVGRFDVVTEEGAEGTLSLPHDNDLLEAEITRHGVALVVVDPLMSAIAQKIDTHREREVRTALDPLSRMADRTGAVVLGIAHFNKSSGTDVSNMITASGAFKNVARAVLGFARDGKGRVMTQTKNSLGRDDLPSLTYSITPVEVPTRRGVAHTARFDFTGTSGRSVEDILREAKDGGGDPDERAERDYAATWVRNYLINKGGSAPFADIRKAADVVEISERTLKRARHRAGARSERRGFQRGATWTIEEPQPGHVSGESPEPGPDGPNGADQGKRGGPDANGGPDGTDVSAGRAQWGHSGHSADAPQGGGPDGCDYPFCESEQAVTFRKPYPCRRCAAHNPLNEIDPMTASTT